MPPVSMWAGTHPSGDVFADYGNDRSVPRIFACEAYKILARSNKSPLGESCSEKR